MFFFEIAHTSWGGTALPKTPLPELESGTVIFLPHLAFPVREAEQAYFSAPTARAKNVSFDWSPGRLAGATLPAQGVTEMTSLLGRFSDSSAALVGALFPDYRGRVTRARTSFRPAEIAGRSTS